MLQPSLASAAGVFTRPYTRGVTHEPGPDRRQLEATEKQVDQFAASLKEEEYKREKAEKVM